MRAVISVVAFGIMLMFASSVVAQEIDWKKVDAALDKTAVAKG